MQIYLKENYVEVNVSGDIRVVERDENGLCFVNGSAEDEKLLGTLGLTASRDSLLAALSGEVEYVVTDELSADLVNPEVKQKLAPLPILTKKGEPYFCQSHSKMHVPGSSEYLACFPVAEKPPSKPKRA